MSSEIDLSQPRDLSGLVAATWSLWSRHRSVFFTVALLIAGPVAIISAGVSRTLDTADANDLTSTDLRGLAILAVLSAIELPLVTGAFARAVQRLGDGETVTVGTRSATASGCSAGVRGAVPGRPRDHRRHGAARDPPGIFLLVRLAFAGQAAAIERVGAGAALRATHARHEGLVVARAPGSGCSGSSPSCSS